MSVGNMNVAYPTIWTKVNTNWSAVNLQTVHFEPVTMEAYQQAQQNAQGRIVYRRYYHCTYVLYLLNDWLLSDLYSLGDSAPVA